MAHDLADALARARRVLARAAPGAAPPGLTERARAALARLRGPTPEPARKEAPPAAKDDARPEGRQVLAQAHVEGTPGDGAPIPATDPAAGAAASRDEAAGKGGARDGLTPSLVSFGGIPVLVDRPRGFVQRKLGPDGAVLWERTFEVDYGYLAGTDGGDAEGLDVFLGPDAAAATAWWAVQIRDDGSFDEYKLFLGFADETAARACYVAHTPERYLASMAPMPVDRLKALLGLPGNADAAAALKTAPALNVARLTRAAKVTAEAAVYTGPTKPGDQAPPEIRAIVETSPLTWRYADTDNMPGWLGGIEPEPGSEEWWVAVVGVDGKTLLWLESEMVGGVLGEPYAFWRPDLAPLELVAATKAATKDEQFIFGIVLVPQKKDLQKEIYGHAVVRTTAHDYLAFFRNTDLQHKVFINEAVELVESTIEKVAFWMARDGTAYPADPVTGAPIVPPDSPYRTSPEKQLRFVPQGAWTVAHRIKDAELWAQIKAGKFTGYSINGLSKKVPLTARAAAALAGPR